MSYRNTNPMKRILKKLARPGAVVGFFDTETTGLGKDAKIIQFSCCLYKLQEDDSFELIDEMDTYINPGEPLSDKIISITGITDFVLQHYRMEDAYAKEIFNFLNRADFIVAYNCEFDKRMLFQMRERQNMDDRIPFCLDALVMARDIIPKSEVENYKLKSISEYIFPEKAFQFHSAFEDVKSMAACCEFFFKKYKAIPDEPVKQKVHLEWASLWINPMQRNMQRIKVNIDPDRSRYGWIFYDIRKYEWNCLKTKEAQCLFEETDIADLEKQVLQKYAWKYDAADMDQLASAWLKEKREREKAS